jgi:hypothetical protein
MYILNVVSENLRYSSDCRSPEPNVYILGGARCFSRGAIQKYAVKCTQTR